MLRAGSLTPTWASRTAARPLSRKRSGYPFLATRLLSAWAQYPSAATAILLLTACSPPPPIVSADTSCERFAHISATDAQIKVFQDNWDVMETYADQVVEHNVTFDKSCLGPVKP